MKTGWVGREAESKRVVGRRESWCKQTGEVGWILEGSKQTAYRMRKRITLLLMWVFQSLMMLEYCYLVSARQATAQQKEEATIPVTTLSPPEGNTTFLDGTTWCVALPGTSQFELQNALDWACGLGKADCSPIQSDGDCFQPDTLLSHASYAFNTYYQQNGNSDIACNFGGTATLIKSDPSYGKCVYAVSGSVQSSAPPISNHKPGLRWWKIAGILLLLYLRC